ncbi:Wzz/FepE/Etk N-terminal domain-containing protein [Micromonospora okii]|uniref:Wzz/FepE/Etk N-terminal domain-containing protein n=1 Tax=Micromonospora okii TaxID=1182970 RepID=UPI001E5F7511|nr:Wzz/FepE/Etk N-terminal domain-containing protein [Micromonospora okii]
MPSPQHADLHDSDGPTLTTYLEWLRRRWWILVVAALLGAGIGMLVSQVQTRTYESTTSLLVRQVGPEASAGTKVNLDTEAQVVRSLVVAERAKALLKSGLPREELVQSVSVTVPPNSQVLQVVYEAQSPAAAQAGSHAFAKAYLDLRLATATRSLENETTALKQQIAETNKQLAAVAGKIAATPPNSVDRARAEADRNVLTSQLASLNSRLSPLLSTAVDPGEIISDAALPGKPSSPNTTLNLASGFGAGLLFGIVLALVLDRLDTRVRRGRDIAGRLGLPVLLELPARPSGLTVLPAAHEVSRELGRLRNVLLSTMPAPQPGRGRQLLLADTCPGPAAGFVVGNLAAAYARTGAQVAVVTTKRNSALTRMLDGVKPRHTLADVLRHDVSALTALTPAPGLGQLRVLLPGDLDSEVELPIATMLDVLAELAARFEHVLIETAEPTVAVEAQALARHVDGVILVVEAGQTRSSEISAAMQQFEQVDAPVLGAVLAPQMTERGPANRSTPAARREGPPSPRPRSAPGGGRPGMPGADSTMILPRSGAGGRDSGPGQAPTPAARPAPGDQPSRSATGTAKPGVARPVQVPPPHGRDPLGQDPHGREPHGRDPLGQDPHGREPHGRDPHGREPHGRDPHGREPHGRDPLGQDPLGQDPHGREPHGREPRHQGPPGQFPLGQAHLREPQRGQFPPREPQRGQSHTGQSHTGQRSAGQAPPPAPPKPATPAGKATVYRAAPRDSGEVEPRRYSTAFDPTEDRE